MSTRRVSSFGRWAGVGALWLGVLAGMRLSGCLSQRCYEDLDCPAPKVCGASGDCVYQCTRDEDCGANFHCQNFRCRPDSTNPIECPQDMVAVADTFCADRHEASRPDATSTSAGSDESRAVSTAGVIPWQVRDNATAQRACEAAGKRLCTPEEWRLSCKGPDGTAYSYGDSYDPSACNGIDAFGRDRFHLAPTGSFPRCTNEWGLFDINGNLWEHVADGSDQLVRGGAYNCGDSAALHKCDYVPGNWSPSARGFRCCRTPPSAKDGAVADADGGRDGEADDGGDGGCIVEDGDAGPDESADGDGPPAGDDGGMEEPDAGEDGAAQDGGDAGGDGPLMPCPPDMVDLGICCMDRYEASRKDATAENAGTDESRAVSRAGVLPWYVNPMSVEARDRFASACEASGKRLCRAEEFVRACQGPGPQARRYFFGDRWDPEICNSVDTYCDDYCREHAIDPCNTNENCGYQYYCFHVMPTGSFPGCTDGSGLFDVNGNVWEIVSSESIRGYEVRGGAFNCGAPSLRFECGFDAGWNDLFAGFRCCRDRAGSF